MSVELRETNPDPPVDRSVRPVLLLLRTVEISSPPSPSTCSRQQGRARRHELQQVARVRRLLRRSRFFRSSRRSALAASSVGHSPELNPDPMTRVAHSVDETPDFEERCASIPPVRRQAKRRKGLLARANLVRYFGVFAPNARVRPRVVPAPARAPGGPASLIGTKAVRRALTDAPQ